MDAVELVEHNITVFRQNSLPVEKITVTQGNALDISTAAPRAPFPKPQGR